MQVSRQVPLSMEKLPEQSPAWKRKGDMIQCHDSMFQLGGYFGRSATGSEGPLQSQFGRGFLLPGIITEWASAYDVRRNASSSSGECGSLTKSSQSAGRGVGQSLRIDRPRPFSRRHRLPQIQSWARVTRLARRAFRSTYRRTSSRCTSFLTGKLLKRPW